MIPGEVAAGLRVDASTVARWCDKGKLRAVPTPGGQRRYYAADVLGMPGIGPH